MPPVLKMKSELSSCKVKNSTPVQEPKILTTPKEVRLDKFTVRYIAEHNGETKKIEKDVIGTIKAPFGIANWNNPFTNEGYCGVFHIPSGHPIIMLEHEDDAEQCVDYLLKEFKELFSTPDRKRIKDTFLTTPELAWFRDWFLDIKYGQFIHPDEWKKQVNDKQEKKKQQQLEAKKNREAMKPKVARFEIDEDDDITE